MATKDQRIAALRHALARISNETRGYTEFSQMGCLHKIAQEAFEADILAAPTPKREADAAAKLDVARSIVRGVLEATK